jgi:alkanesulfonate monooxygenase SsuD/methylene tetrahydromethanopterin reductase-like flavin-dependent oxidoreductase (luciferase family)
LLAKISATLDNISGGRLEFGIGAGGTGRADWSRRLGFRTEYNAYGMDFPEKAAIRIGRLREAVQIIKKLWMESKVSYRGRHYRIEDAFSYPKPLQKPHPPVWIGGTGEKFLLKVVAQEADGWNAAWNLSPQQYQDRLDSLSEYCNDFGRSLASIRKSLLTACVTAQDANELGRALREIAKPYDEMRGYIPYALRPSALTGTVDECVRKISEFRDAGVTDFILVFPDFETDRWLSRFVMSVMPSF